MDKGEILQNGIESLAVQRWIDNALKWIGGHDDEQQKGNGHQRLNGQDMSFEAWRQIAPEGRDHGTVKRQNGHPQQHGAFMIGPHAGNLEEQGFGGMGIGKNILYREIRGDIGPHQRQKGNQQQHQLCLRRRDGNAHQHRDRIYNCPISGTANCTMATINASMSAKCPVSIIIAHILPCKPSNSLASPVFIVIYLSCISPGSQRTLLSTLNCQPPLWPPLVSLSDHTPFFFKEDATSGGI